MSNMLTKEQITKALANDVNARTQAAFLIVEMSDASRQARQLKWWQFARKRLYRQWSKLCMRKAEAIVETLNIAQELKHAARS